MSLSLYNLADLYRETLDRVDDSGGELDDTLEAELDTIEGSFADKIEACCAIIREQELTAAAIKAEADRLKVRSQSEANKATRLKAYVQDCMKRAGVNREKTPRFTVSIQNSPPSAKWLGSEDDIPASYRREKTEVTFDARAAIDDFKAGVPLPEGVVVTRGQHLVIR